jgi:hypothetical protein
MSEIHLAIEEILEGNPYYTDDLNISFAIEYYLEEMEIDFIRFTYVSTEKITYKIIID